MISNRWKLALAALPIIGTCAMAQPQPGGLGGFYQAWYGKKLLAAIPVPFIYYTFDTGGDDSSGNGYDITTIQNVSFESGYAVFNGTNNYLTRTSFSQINNYSEFTVCFWVYRLSFIDSFPRLTEKGANSEWTLAHNAGVSSNMVLQINGPAGTSIGVPYTTNVWEHIALTFSDGSNWVVYADGVQRYSTVQSYVGETGNINIGGNPSFTVTDFHGYIDDWRYYTNGLPSNVVFEIYNLGRP